MDENLTVSVSPTEETPNLPWTEVIAFLMQPNLTIVKSTQWMNLVVIPFISIVGLSGNISSAGIMMSRQFRHRSTSVYFTALAIADSLCILDRFIFEWLLARIVAFDPSEETDILCKFRRAMGYTVLPWAAWLLVAVTTERFLVTLFPFHAVRLCSVKVAKVVVLMITVAFGTLWFGFVFGHGVGAGLCDFTKLNKTLFVWGRKLFASLYSYTPNATLLVLNTAIAGMLIYNSKKMKKMTGDESKSAYRATRPR